LKTNSNYNCSKYTYYTCSCQVCIFLMGTILIKSPENIAEILKDISKLILVKVATETKKLSL